MGVADGTRDAACNFKVIRVVGATGSFEMIVGLVVDVVHHFLKRFIDRDGASKDETLIEHNK